MAKQKGAGRPPKYESKEQIEGLIEDYFKKCEGEILKDTAGDPVLNKWGMPVIIGEKPPTVTGLALALGFASRQALLNYQGKKEFNDTITRAKLRVEEYAESRLFDRDGSNGARFSLINNFKGWSDKPKSDLDRQEQEARISYMNAQTGMLADKRGKQDDAKEQILQNMQTLADILQNTQPDRNIEDYEE